MAPTDRRAGFRLHACICIVFVPVLLLTGAAKYLFTPLALAVVFAMLASYLLSRTLIPTMVHYLLKPELKLYVMGEHGEAEGGSGFIWHVHHMFNRRFEAMRTFYSGLLDWALRRRKLVLIGFAIFVTGSLCLAPFVGQDFFPIVDAGQLRLHARAPAGTRIEKTEMIFADIDDEIRHVIPANEIDTIIDNIGIPFGGFNLAFGDNATIGSDDGDILISLKTEKHGPVAAYREILRRRLHERFPDVTFFFEAANITNQILNFGLPAPIDVQVIGHDAKANYEISRSRSYRAHSRRVDVHSPGSQLPEIRVNVDRVKPGRWTDPAGCKRQLLTARVRAAR